MNKKGYLIQLAQLKKGQELDKEFKKQMLEWLDDKSEKWQVIVKKSQKTVKERAKKAVKNFFTV